MVSITARFDSPASPADPASDPDAFSQYSQAIDRDHARVDPDTSTLHPYVFHEAFKPRPRLTRMEQRELAIKQCALRIAAGLEMRSLRALAREIDCTHTALDNALLRLCDRVGMRKYHVSDTTRRKQSEARMRQVQAK